ncbi:hypothetical protein E4K72_10170 [Oxalobacteraceae bacterium OM1]|nr:hypothetical protein E4K72_10170 [Oxalobacteraceae bacterium OM1]
MSPHHACLSFLPAHACSHADMAAYLLPSLLLAGLIHAIGKRHDAAVVFYLAGTICHELAHWLVGILTFARPVSLTVIPRRAAGQWTLGAVRFANLRWYNAAPTALAPMLVLAVPLAVAFWRVAGGWSFGWLDLGLAFLLAPQFLSFWPSRQDWRLALASWPYALLAAGGWWLIRHPFWTS